MSETPDQGKKIIIDEDWKSQVEAEKAAARAREQEGQADAPSQPRAGSLPPASLSFLVTTLATQSMVAMGLVPNPLTNQAERRPDEAKHFIDTLQVLYEKTEGNRTPDETQLMDNVLHELRMGFISVQDGGGKKPQ